MNNKTVQICSIVAAVAAVAAAGFAYHEREALDELRSQCVAGELQSVARLLKENQALIQELQIEPFSEKDSGILESYLAKIRRDGVAQHADMKQRLDTLAENNTAIVTLIKVHEAHARTLAFSSEADMFRNYASAWRDRWNSVMELFMAGGNYAASGVPFPKEFLQAVNGEIAAAN
jgi:hypothetical protein